MAYSKAKLKSSGDRASPCLRPLLIGNLTDTFLPTRTLLYVSVRFIFIHLTSFLGIPNSMRIFRNFPGISASPFRSVHIQHHTKLYAKRSTILVSSFNFSSTWWWKGSYFLLKLAFASAISDLSSCVHLATSVTVSYKATSVFSTVMNKYFSCRTGG